MIRIDRAAYGKTVTYACRRTRKAWRNLVRAFVRGFLAGARS